MTEAHKIALIGAAVIILPALGYFIFGGVKTPPRETPPPERTDDL